MNHNIIYILDASQTLLGNGTSRQEVVETIGYALTQKRSNQDNLKTPLPGITRRISQTVKTQLVQDILVTVNEMRKLRLLFGKPQAPEFWPLRVQFNTKNKPYICLVL